MTKTEIEQERAMLAGEVFEGVEPWVRWAAMNNSKNWYLYSEKPLRRIKSWCYEPYFYEWGLPLSCKNQPETSLDWTDTLIKRSDYE